MITVVKMKIKANFGLVCDLWWWRNGWWNLRFHNVQIDFANKAKNGDGYSMVQVERRHTQTVIGGYGGGFGVYWLCMSAMKGGDEREHLTKEGVTCEAPNSWANDVIGGWSRLLEIEQGLVRSGLATSDSVLALHGSERCLEYYINHDKLVINHW